MSEQFGIVGDVRQKATGAGGVIHSVTIVLQSVAHDEIVGTEHAVVSNDLIENGLRDFHRGGFVFHDEARTPSVAMAQHGVASPCGAVQIEAHLIGHEHGREVLVVDEEVHEVLAHPLFGCQCHVSTAQPVVDGGASLLCARAIGVGRKIEWLHGFGCE